MVAHDDTPGPDTPRDGVMWPFACTMGFAVDHGTGNNRHLRVVCDCCKAESPVDAVAWCRERAGGASLRALRERMRCSACGARAQVHFDIMYGPQPTNVSGPTTIWRFI